MTTTTVDIEKTPTDLAQLLQLTKQGTEVVIVRGEQTLARLVPAAAVKPRIGNLNPDSITTSDDFDAPLPDDFWLGSS